MGFFKSILSDSVGSAMAEALTGKAAKKLGSSLMNKAAEAAVGAAVSTTTRAAMNSLLNKKPLETPAPPAVPKPEQPSMSVMIAVNGQSYGPYERATLLEMIGNGSLTRDTYVFIQGMDNWKVASDVPQVLELFSVNAPAPAAPPVPWAAPADQAAATAPSQPTACDNTLSARLNSLINAAVADGEISDLERQVLIRNAQQEGVSMDEFVMVLEARLFEQQQVLRSHQEEKQRKDAAVQIQMTAVANASAPKSTAPRAMTKCPHCGAPVRTASTSCPECGYDYPADMQGSAWERLNMKLEEIRTKEEPKRSFWDDNYLDKDEQMAQTIQNFPIPVSKRDIIDFFTSCAPLGKPVGFFNNKTASELTLQKAYYAKAQQVLLKARITLKGDPELLEQVESMAKMYKIKA